MLTYIAGDDWDIFMFISIAMPFLQYYFDVNVTLNISLMGMFFFQIDCKEIYRYMELSKIYEIKWL